jgi:hypothetical protein
VRDPAAAFEACICGARVNAARAGIWLSGYLVIWLLGDGIEQSNK